MTLKQWEKKVLRVEQFRIVVRAPADTKVLDYSYKKAAPEKWRIHKFLVERVYPMLNGCDIVVLMADGKDAHGKRNLKSVKESYKRR
jgi:hypothetical protein